MSVETFETSDVMDSPEIWVFGEVAELFLCFRYVQMKVTVKLPGVYFGYLLEVSVSSVGSESSCVVSRFENGDRAVVGCVEGGEPGFFLFFKPDTDPSPMQLM